MIKPALARWQVILVLAELLALPAAAQQPLHHTPNKPALPFWGIERGDYGGKIHYLSNVMFTPENTLFPGSFKFRPDGSFDVALRNPNAAKCTTIAVHMPKTGAALSDRAAWIDEKHALFKQFEALRRGQIDQLKAELDLSPSASFAFDRGWALESCTIFFRDVDGRYRDSTADIVTKHVP